MLKRILKAILSFLPPFMRPVFTRLYYDTIMLPKVLYLRLTCRRISKNKECDLDSIMSSLDRWAFKHSGIFKHSSNGYISADIVPGMGHPPDSISQVRQEIAEFVKILLLKDLDNNILEIGMGDNGGTHILWRHIFNTVVTIEISPDFVKKFKRSEWLDSRSIIVTGRSEDPGTLKRVRAYLDSVDVLFIDGDHSYEAVARDWAIYHNLVRPGGLVAFHDSACRLLDYGVARFLDDLSVGTVDGKCYALNHIVHSDNVGISYYEQS